MVVSHDRYFLDRVTSDTWEIALGTLEQYRGSYSKYLPQLRSNATRSVFANGNPSRNISPRPRITSHVISAASAAKRRRVGAPGWSGSCVMRLWINRWIAAA